MPVSADVLLTHSEKERALMDAKFIARPCLPLSTFSVRLRACGDRTRDDEKFESLRGWVRGYDR